MRKPENEQRQANEEGQKEQQKNGEQVKKKVKKSFALKPEHFQTKKGLQSLYELTSQVNWDDKMTIQSAMNLITVTLKTWQYNMVPKYSFDYFTQRCQSLSSHKLLSAYLAKARRVHKGIQQWDDFQADLNPQNNQHPQQHLQQNVHQNHENLQQRIKITRELGENVDESQKQNKYDIDQMMDEDLKMFEEMNRRGNHKKPIEDEMDGIDLGGDYEQFSYEDYE